MRTYVHYKIQQKTISLFLIICFVTTSLVFVSIPNKVSAVCTPYTVPATPDPMSVPTHPSKTDAWNIADATQKSNIWFKTCVLDGIATTLGKQIIKQLTNSTVKWVNSGFKGNPAFVQDTGKFFGGIADKVAGNVIENIAPFLCSPFRLNIQLAMAMSQSSNTQEELGCTLTDVENNLKNFASGTGGGWSNWLEITQNPQNNPYGASMLAGIQLNASIETEQGKYQQQLDWGRGFLSQEDCSGQSVGRVGNDKRIYDANNQPVYGVQAGSKGCVTKTPGVVIESQLNNVIGSDLRGLEVAQSIDQIYSALVGQLMSQALGGLGGLANAGKTDSSGSNNFNYQNSYGATNIPNLPLTGSCTVDKQNAQVGDVITWRAYVPDINGNVSYTWYGDENIISTSSIVRKIYSENGYKTASVIVSTSGQNSQTLQMDCVPGVLIGNTSNNFSTPAISCSVSSTETQKNTPVTWQAVVVGGVPPFIYSWEGDENLTGTGQNIVKSYRTTGTKNAIVNITSADGNVYSNQCATTVNVMP